MRFFTFLMNFTASNHHSFPKFFLQIMVEYDSAEVDRFIDAADAIEDAFPGIIVDGVEVEDRPGAFKIFLEDGTEIFKRESNTVDVPSNDNLLASLSQAGVRPAS
jgi:hypothetical protein